MKLNRDKIVPKRYTVYLSRSWTAANGEHKTSDFNFVYTCPPSEMPLITMLQQYPRKQKWSIKIVEIKG